MVTQFYADLNKARQAEVIVAQVLAEKAPDFTFELVGDQRKYFHIGDIKVTNKKTKKTVFLEVKDDSRIHETRNVLCEERVYYKSDAYEALGNMYSQYQIYCVVSQRERKIYIIDFEMLKEMYRRFEAKIINHPTQVTTAHLVPLSKIKSSGALIAEIAY